MEDTKILAELTEALTSIQRELQHMNKTLSTIAAQSKASPSRESTGRAYPERPSMGRPPAGRSAGRPPGKSPRSAAFKRDEEGDESGFADKAPFRFATKKKSPPRPKGKLPPKKGNGYPKKSP